MLGSEKEFQCESQLVCSCNVIGNIQCQSQRSTIFLTTINHGYYPHHLHSLLRNRRNNYDQRIYFCIQSQSYYYRWKFPLPIDHFQCICIQIKYYVFCLEMWLFITNVTRGRWPLSDAFNQISFVLHHCGMWNLQSIFHGTMLSIFLVRRQKDFFFISDPLRLTL